MKNRFLNILLLCLPLIVLSNCTDDKVEKATAFGIVEASYINWELPMAIQLKDNETIQLTPFIMPTRVVNKMVHYENLNPEIYSITEGGLITPLVQEGDGYLRVSTTDGSNLSATYLVRITDHVIYATGIDLPIYAETITVAMLPLGQFYDLGSVVSVIPSNAFNQKLIYSIEDTSIATVTEEGVVYPVSVGETTITITADDKKNDISPVEVKVVVLDEVNKVQSITIDAAYQNVTLRPEESLDLSEHITVSPADAFDPNVTYSTSNAAVATVTDGMIKAIAGGTAIITVTARDGGGASATSTITVRNANDLSRANWTVTFSQAYLPESDTKGPPQNMIDGVLSSYGSMLKPGKSYEVSGSPYEMDADAVLFYTLDMGSVQSFDYYKHHHRTDVTAEGLRLNYASIYVSDTGSDWPKKEPFEPTSDWELVKENVYINGAKSADGTNYGIIYFDETIHARYVRVLYTGWSDASASIGISEIYYGYYN